MRARTISRPSKSTNRPNKARGIFRSRRCHGIERIPRQRPRCPVRQAQRWRSSCCRSWRGKRRSIWQGSRSACCRHRRECGPSSENGTTSWSPFPASPVRITGANPIQPCLDIARRGSCRGRSSVKNLTSDENRSYLVKSARGTKRICSISGERGLVCPDFRLRRNASNPSRGAHRK